MSLAVNDLRNGVVFQDQAGVWQVQSFEHIKMGRGSAVIKIKAKNLKTGAISEKSFISGNKVEEAEYDKRTVQYLYHDGTNLYFMDPTSFDQLSLVVEKAKELPRFIKEGSNVDLLVVEGEPVGVELPKNVVLAVTEAPPGEKGNSASNVTKGATVETGISVQVPLFVKPGDKIKVDTRSGEYLERA